MPEVGKGNSNGSETANPSSLPSDLAVDNAVVAAHKVIPCWVDGETIAVEEFVTGEGAPCQAGCIVEIEYAVSDNVTGQYLIIDEKGNPVSQKITFAVGDKGIPGGMYLPQ